MYIPHDRVTAMTGGLSLTKQSMQDECDVNQIVARFEDTGLATHINEHQGEYGDFTAVEDYHTSLNRVVHAQQMFLSLPAKIRQRFGNDPHNFLEFTGKKENEAEMAEMGLIPKRKAAEPPSEAPEEPKPPKRKPGAEINVPLVHEDEEGS
ncbi:MAG: internal scaffolding protein [Microviridae sp.]|nr:MAG: internal scaffolding protein [Microviridae sp.]